MIVTCPNCQTRYNLPDEKVPAKGAKVKCSKCTHVFKTPPPQAMPEDEVESLFEQESASTDTRAGERFDETFDEVASASAAEPKGAPPADVDAGFPEAPEEPGAGDDEMPGMDDLFDDEDETPDGEGLFDDDEAESESLDDRGHEASGEAADDLFEETGSEPDDDLFAGDEEDGEDQEEDEDDVAGFGLDDEPARKGSRSLGCLIVILVLALGLGAAVYFKAWTLLGVDPAAYFQNVPYLGRLFMEPVGDRDAAPGESPADRVRRIELKNVKQYYVANEKTGNLFVVEGKAVNVFSTPKERIRVEVVLYDEAGTVLASQALLCGNVLSQFQLQVQTQKEIEDGLASEVGILSNNTFIRPGSSTPFMAVFFQPPPNVKEFLVKVVDVGDPS
ncbi:DUF3426 domain-containing protein [Pseudodesulfovibrio sp. F-1]|uniref:DUF3426 domain-containing protein n=1 Tax=Pseudodesulfovibrio alkaliphilus TaxID=2661613 RepID=A0A7K1KMW2_9BACT|nr:DUF3426 domain-containing protein [Pseudodesulfovibrio alkaliphilus]MUM77418.1 DUF3426 domain-containing protein [Pseudodesulfovibrio alkaliphilus]